MKEIKRLKGDLKYAYKENREAHADRTKRNPDGIKQIKESLKVANDHCSNKIKMQRENEYYKNVNTAYQRALSNDYKGNLFISEGVKTNADHVNVDTKALQKDISDLLFNYDRDMNEFCAETSGVKDIQKREEMIYDTLKRVDKFCDEIKKDTVYTTQTFDRNVAELYCPKEIKKTKTFNTTKLNKK